MQELDYTLRFDDVTIERHAALLPEDMRDAFTWLVRYTRDECSRQVAILEKEFRKCGVQRDYNTWTKILKGQWNRHPNGTEREHPIINKEKLLEEINTLRNGVRVEAARGRVPFVMTSTAEAIFRFLEKKLLPERVNKFGVIIGPTGSQKTATFKEFCRQHNHGATVWVEAPENLSELLIRLARAFGGPAREPYDRSRQRIFDSLNERRMVIVDNTQRLYKENRGSDQTIFNFLQRVQDETGCAVIMSITPAFERTLTEGMSRGYFEQFEGRSGGNKSFLRLPEYAPVEDVLAIAKAFGLRDAARHEKLLVKLAQMRGRIRILFEVLQDAKILAEAEKKPLTVDYIREVYEEET